MAGDISKLLGRSHMFNKTRQRLKNTQRKMKQWRFNLACRRSVLSTKPLHIRESELKILSMVSHFDLVMYLIAVKSFYAHIGTGQIIVLNDGTLTSDDIKLLTLHLPSVQIKSIDDIQSASCPTYVSWKRLLSISNYVKEHYVIQLDSDTITLGDIPEVIDAIKENRSFITGTSLGRQISSMDEICHRMKGSQQKHVQVIAEQNFDKLRDYRQLKYVRGSAGFAGFARGSFSRAQVEALSTEIEHSIGQIWHNWGSEQVMSNLMIANSPKSSVLPYPKYSGFTPKKHYDQSAFLHFVGAHRFKRGVYRKLAADIITKLN
jgi:hypothetical protein